LQNGIGRVKIYLRRKREIGNFWKGGITTEVGQAKHLDRYKVVLVRLG